MIITTSKKIREFNTLMESIINGSKNIGSAYNTMVLLIRAYEYEELISVSKDGNKLKVEWKHKNAPLISNALMINRTHQF